MDFSSDFLPLFLILGLAWLSPLITSRINIVNIPSVIVEIGFGMLIGPYVFDILPDAEYMDFLGLMGFVFLMFLSGLEVDVSQVINSMPRRKITWSRYLTNPLLMGITIYTGTLLLAAAGAYLLSLFQEITHIWYFALIISTSSVGVIMPVIKDRGETQQHFGQMLILGAAVADILSILLFTFTTSYIKEGPGFEVFLILALFAAFLIFYYLGRYLRQFNFVKKIQFQLSHAAAQIKVRGTLAIIMLFLILSQLINAEVILGAFLVGLLLSYFTDKDRSSLLMKLDGMGYGFFIPIFFILVGARIDLSVFSESGNMVFFLIALFFLLYLIKMIPATLWSRVFGWKKALTGGVLLSSRLSLIIAAAQVGLTLGVISPAMNTSFVILAVITCVLSPVVYNQVNKKEEEHEQQTIIIGGGPSGVFLARNLRMHEKKALVIEQNKDHVKNLKSQGFSAIHGNGADPDLYKDINLHPDDYVVLLTGSESRNYKIAEILKEQVRHKSIITYSIENKSIQKLKTLGIEYLNGAQVVAAAIENLIFRPTTYHTMFESFETFRVETLKITSKDVADHQVKDIPFHQDGFLMMIKRNGDYIIPHGEDYLKLGDEAVIFGTNTAIWDFQQKFTHVRVD